MGGILDYAAEDDTKPDPDAEKQSDQVVARRFDYATEARCDQHMEAFKRSIAAAAEAPGQGFAAIKVGPEIWCIVQLLHAIDPRAKEQRSGCRMLKLRHSRLQLCELVSIATLSHTTAVHLLSI